MRILRPGDEECLERFLQQHADSSLFLRSNVLAAGLRDEGNARHPDCVQIGAVWTPPQRRSRGFGRCVVAGALRLARSEGVTRSILFTAEANAPAQAAYRCLGDLRIGDYGLVLFRDRQQAGTFSE